MSTPSCDKARLYIDSEGFHKGLVVHLRNIEDLTPDSILSRLEKIIQSDESIPLDQSFAVSVGVQVQPDLRGTHGEGKYFHDLALNNKWNCLFRRKCVIQMKNSDNLCVSRSLVILRSKFAGDGQYKNLIHPHKLDSMGTFGLKR